jgi:hypothetical protein
VLVKPFGEGLDTVFLGLQEGGLGVLVHRDEVYVVAAFQVAQPSGETVGVLHGVVDPGEEHVLEEEALVGLEAPGVQGLPQTGQVPGAVDRWWR